MFLKYIVLSYFIIHWDEMSIITEIHGGMEPPERSPQKHRRADCTGLRLPQLVAPSAQSSPGTKHCPPHPSFTLPICKVRRTCTLSGHCGLNESNADTDSS